MIAAKEFEKACVKIAKIGFKFEKKLKQAEKLRKAYREALVQVEEKEQYEHFIDRFNKKL